MAFFVAEVDLRTPGTTIPHTATEGHPHPRVASKEVQSFLSLPGENNPYVHTSANELMVNWQTRTTVADTHSEYTTRIGPQIAKVIVGYAFEGTRGQTARLTVRDQDNRLVFESLLTHDGRTSWRDIGFEITPGRLDELTFEVAPVAATIKVVLSRPALVGREIPAGAPKNLILISLDTVRADYLGLYGMSEYPTSPFLDSYAKGGTVFERAIAPSPWTVPSHMALLTGIDPDALGMARPVGQTPRLEPQRTTLAELFSRAGYLTIAFTGRGTLAARNGYSDGFFLYQESTVRRQFIQRDLDGNMYQTLQWLEKHRSEPFFLFFHTFEAHAPYGHARFIIDTDNELLQAKQAYMSGLAYIDEKLEGFFADLDRLGVLDDTLVVITSDHGEGFDDHPPYEKHGETLYDEMIHVPLIFVGPRIPKGLRVVPQMGLVDVFSTLTDIFDLPTPARSSSMSLRPLMEGKPIEPRRIHLCCLATHIRQMYGIRTDQWKFFYDTVQNSPEPAGSQHLYDLKADPAESNNLAKPGRDELGLLMVETLGRARSNFETGQTNKPDQSQTDAVLLEQLRALGYVE